MKDDPTEKPVVLDLAALGINFDFKEEESSIQPEQKEQAQAVPVQTSTTVIVQEKPPFPPRLKMLARFGVFLIGVGILFYGRYSVPSDDIACVEDKIIDVLKFANDFLNEPGHEGYRRAFQIICSLFVDIVFLVTMGLWVFRGNSCRLPLTLAVFYVIRAAIQKIFFLPFTEGYYWDDPGFPSLVVPYGRGSDFFYSGHTGFLVICARELHLTGYPKSRNLAIVTLIYTMLVLVVYRIHYSIDVFTGFFFADWCFIRMNQLKDYLDPLIFKILVKIKSLIFRKRSQKQENKDEDSKKDGQESNKDVLEKADQENKRDTSQASNQPGQDNGIEIPENTSKAT